jgi:hypothetical protein
MRLSAGRRRVNASSMPAVRDEARLDEPPAEMNGKVMPLAGKSPTLTPMLINA